MQHNMETCDIEVYVTGDAREKILGGQNCQMPTVRKAQDRQEGVNYPRGFIPPAVSSSGGPQKVNQQ